MNYSSSEKMFLSNSTIVIHNSYPIWYFINDILIIIINIIGILSAIVFIYIIFRLNYPAYSISNLIACKTCFTMGLMSFIILWNNIYALASDFRGFGYIDSLCHIRGTAFNILFVKMYTSLCLKAFNRLRCIVYRLRSVPRTHKSLLIFILIQWLFAGVLILPIFLTDGVNYDWGSHLCLVTLEKPWQFIYLSKSMNKLIDFSYLFFYNLVIIYFISILFISSVYLYILYYVIHISLLERYRRKRQYALIRRIFLLLFMLILPGVFYFALMLYWTIFHSLPSYTFKVKTLFESLGHTGAILTIFLSNSRVRRRFYAQKKKKKKFKPIPKENFGLIILKPC